MTLPALRQRLPRLLLIGAVLLLLALVLRESGRWAEESGLAAQQEQTRHQLSLYIANLRRELEKYEFLPELLAGNERLAVLLRSPDDPELVRETNQLLEQINRVTGASDTYLMDAVGLTLAASNWRSHTPFVGENFSYRPYFRDALEGRLGHYFALGTTSNRRGYYFAYPVSRDGQIRGVVAVKVNIASLETHWGGEQTEFMVTDPDGVIFSTTHPGWKFRTLLPLAPEQRQRIQESRRYGEAALAPIQREDRRTLENGDRILALRERNRAGRNRMTEFLVTEESMPGAGWNVHALTRLDGLEGQVLRVQFLVALLGVALLLTGQFLNQQRSRRLERARYEQAAKRTLEASEKRVRAIIDNTHAGLVTTDAGGRIEFFNPTAEQLFGYRSDEVSGQHISQLLPPDQADLLSCPLDTPDYTEAAPPVETTGLRRDGTTFPMELAMRQVRRGREPRFIATVHDISERKRHEAALRRAHALLETRVQERTADLSRTNERLTREIDEHRHTEKALRHTQIELIQAARLATIGQMATGISHELNQPLAAIRAYADNARALIDHQRAEEAGWNLEQIAHLTGRMAEIGAQLKVFARRSGGQMVAVSLTAAVDAALAILAPRLKGAETRVVRDLPATDLLVRADAVRLEQVLVNLIHNALQAMEHQAEATVEIAAVRTGERVRLTLRDHGPGIADCHLNQVFDPFFTTKESGLGLGLSISLRIVEEMGGRLTARNHPGGGAEFTLELNAAD